MTLETLNSPDRLYSTILYVGYTVWSLAQDPCRHKSPLTTQTTYNEGFSVPLLQGVFKCVKVGPQTVWTTPCLLHRIYKTKTLLSYADSAKMCHDGFFGLQPIKITVWHSCLNTVLSLSLQIATVQQWFNTYRYELWRLFPGKNVFTVLWKFWNKKNKKFTAMDESLTKHAPTMGCTKFIIIVIENGVICRSVINHC